MTDQAEALTYARKWALTRSWITYFRRTPSDPKSRQISEQLQGRRIGQRIEVLDRLPVDHVSYGQLGDFPADGPRNIGHLEDFLGDVVGAGKLPDPAPDPANDGGAWL